MSGRLMVLLITVKAEATAVLDIRVRSSIEKRLPVRTVLLILLLLFCIGLQQSASAQQPGMSVPVANAPLSIDQVVENLVRMNLERAQALHAYHGTRIYRVEYRGFPGTRNAEMVVDVKYQSPGTKEFTIQSATGSRIIIDKVFKKLLQAEKDALAAEAQTAPLSTAIIMISLWSDTKARPSVPCTYSSWSPERRISFFTAAESG